MRITIPDRNPETALVPVCPGPDQVLKEIKKKVLDSVVSPLTKRAYGQALNEFLNWLMAEQTGELTKAVVNRYRSQLEASGISSSTVNKHLSAIRKLVEVGADDGWVSPVVAESIRRVKGAKRQGVRLGNWLPQEDAQRLLDLPDSKTARGNAIRRCLLFYSVPDYGGAKLLRCA